MARRFGELGANIVISGRRKEVLEETAHDFSEQNINVLTCPGDVRKIEDVEIMSKQTLDKFGTVDALLNNAAGNFISPTEALKLRVLLSMQCHHRVPPNLFDVFDRPRFDRRFS